MNTQQTCLNAVRSLGRFSIALALGIVLVVALPATHAAPPELMTYQGFLVDGNGNALAPSTPANYPVVFRIFTASIGGTRLWSEQQIVTVDKGNFSVILGEGTPVGGELRPLLSSVLAGPNNAERYMSLSVTIGGTTTEMLPRLRLLPAPYAFTATSANNLVNPAGIPAVSYANSQVEVSGNLSVSGVISGDGSGLTGLTLAQLPALNASSISVGTLADTRLSANVALRLGGNTFTGNQTIAGNLGLGTLGTTFPLTIGNNTLGDKISLFGQSGNSYGFGIQGGLLQIHSESVSSDIGFGYGSSAAMTETMRIKGNGNVGIGTSTPSGKLTVNGGVRARGGAPGGGGANDNGFAFTANGGDNDSGMFSSADGQLEFYGNSAERLRITPSGNVGINTATPTATLEVNGSIKAASVTVNGLTVNGPVNAATFNGEKAPAVFTVGGNVNVWRDVLVDGTALLGDADGGRIKILLRNHNSKEVRTLSYEFYCENDTDNFGQPLRYGWTVGSYGQQRGFRLGSGNNDWRADIASDWDWYWLRNYRSGQAIGAVDGPAFGPGDRYKFYMLVPPSISATVILYDR
ncbi:MAG: hypothetical protein JNN07_24090 [Verrucomicrobiales bacterium]|nr:hypothetical protein [Verrucomicrobiales bacterium]